jgi:Fe-S cluster biogenesis protein NfuA/nitrite reductase/ring-hydroxylating ferredoxin subunit
MLAARATPAEPGADLEALLGDIARLEVIFESWEATPRAAVAAWAQATDALHAEALKRLVRALKEEPAALKALRGALADEVVYAVLRKHQIIRASLPERVEAALARVRPMLATHGGDVELVAIDAPTVQVRFTGACDGCPASLVTFHEGVKKALEEACPELTRVVQVKGSHGVARATGVRSPFQAGGGWRFAAQLADLAEDVATGVLVEGARLLLARRGEEVVCFENACAHLGLTLDGGEVKDGLLTCPHHGFQYALSTGECVTAPAVQLQPRPVQVVGGEVQVQVQVRVAG